jgi:hypothetical protein
MQEGNNVGKVSLMIAYKKHVLPGKFGNMLGAPDLKFINDNQPRPGNNAYDGV